MKPDFDVAIAGSGFAGSLLACLLRQRGLRVVLLERGRHPRFVIGESTSPLANLLLEELATQYELPGLLPLTSYGPWQRHYPELPVGLKRGFSFYQHQEGEPYRPDDRSRRLMVAASPCEEVADTHWYRPLLDQFLVGKAVELGCDYVDEFRIEAGVDNGSSVQVRGNRRGIERQVTARWFVDATGPRGLSFQLGAVQARPAPYFPHTTALYNHFQGVGRFAVQASDGEESLPFDPDDAAQHHLFPGGWIWVLRFNNGVTSAGVMMERQLAAEVEASADADAWGRLIGRYPSIRELFAGATPVESWRLQSGVAFQADRAAWGRCILLPSAAASIDPLFSTGIPLTLLGVQRAAPLLVSLVETPDPGEETKAKLGDYCRTTLEEADFAARLVAACYRRFDNMQAFADLSMIYFVAASFSEVARRMGRSERAPGYLLSGSPAFRAAAANILDGAAPAPLLAPFNLAGLCDPERRGVYPVDLQDLRRSAAITGASEQEMDRFIQSQQARMNSRTWPGEGGRSVAGPMTVGPAA